MKSGQLIKICSVILLTVLFYQPVLSQDKVGTSAGSFLGISIGTAASAMGGAYVSYARDASALYWNPGAISRIGYSHVAFTHTNWLIGTDYNWGGLVFNLGSGNALGLQIGMLDTGEEEVTTIYYPEGTGERWSAQFTFVGISYAQNMTDRFSIGGSAKMIQEKIYHETATGYAFDVGLLYITRLRGMRLGMSISNFGTKMQLDGKDLLHTYDQDEEHLGNNPTISSKLKTAKWPLPLFFRVGVSMDVIQVEKNTLSIAVDSVVPTDNTTIINVGGEYNLNQIFFLRCGYKSLMREKTEEGLTAGVGFNYNVPGLALINLDYAFNDYGIIGDVHTIGFGFKF